MVVEVGLMGRGVASDQEFGVASDFTRWYGLFGADVSLRWII